MDNYYEFKYKYNNIEIVHKINADLLSCEMYCFIRDFLLGCSWQPDTVDKIIGKEE